MNLNTIKKTNFYGFILLLMLLKSNFSIAQFNASFFPQFSAYTGNPIIRYGDGFPNAAWNDPSVIKIGNQYIMYTTAANGIFLSDTNEVKVYRQTSNDGINWTLDPLTPVLEPMNGTYYNGGTETPSVVIKDGIYHMYTTCYPPGNDPSSYVIAHATSNDGLSWTMDANPTLTSNEENVFYSEIVGEPGAIVYRDSIYVYFTAAGIVDGITKQGIGCIKSADGSTFGAPELTINLPTDVYETADYWGLSTPSALAINDSIYVFTDVAQTINGQWTQVALHQFKTDGTSGIWYHDTVPIHHMQDFPWTDGDYLSNLLAPCPLLEEDGTLRIWYAGQNIANFVGNDTLYNVNIDSLGMIQVIPEFYGIGTSSYQFHHLSVSELNFVDKSIQVYPNPSCGTIQIKLDKALETEVCIINSLGNLVKERFFVNKFVTDVNLENLDNGMYYITLSNSTQAKQIKIVLNK